MVRILVAVLLSASLFAGCKDGSAQEEASAPQGTADLMAEVAKAPEFQPPADNRLNERQVEMYLAVQDRRGDLPEVDGDQVAAELRAAQELGFNPKEYQWVKDRVLEARMLMATRSLSEQLAQSRQSLLASLEERKRTALDAAEEAEIDRQIAELRESSPGIGAEAGAAQDFNAGLLVRYEDEIARIEAEDQRAASDLEVAPASQEGVSQRVEH